MKKLILLLTILVSAFAVKAQDSTLIEYPGKYVFPEGGPVSSVNISIDKGTLVASSDAGSSELRKTNEKDVFDIVSYQGIATFRRNTEGKVVGLQLVIGETVMEGTRDGGGKAALKADKTLSRENFRLKDDIVNLLTH